MGYVVRATWIAAAGETDAVAAILRELAEASRRESGCRTYEVYVDPAEPAVFEIYERYEDEAAFDEHVASEHFRRLVVGEAIPRLADRSRAFYASLD